MPLTKVVTITSLSAAALLGMGLLIAQGVHEFTARNMYLTHEEPVLRRTDVGGMGLVTIEFRVYELRSNHERDRRVVQIHCFNPKVVEQSINARYPRSTHPTSVRDGWDVICAE